MLEKLRRQIDSSSSTGTIFDKDVFLRTFFPSLTRIYDANPDLRESMENQFRPVAFQFMEDMNATARKAYSDQRDAEIDESRARHQLAKKPRLNPENLGTGSPRDSPSPGEYSEEEVEFEDNRATISFHDFVDHIGSRFSKAAGQLNRSGQRIMALSLLNYVSPIGFSIKPKEWEKSLYGIDNESQRRRQLKPKPKKN